MKSSKNAKKHEILKYSRKTEKNRPVWLKTGEIGRKIDAKNREAEKMLAFLCLKNREFAVRVRGQSETLPLGKEM